MANTQNNTINLGELLNGLGSFVNYLWKKRVLFLGLALSGMLLFSTYYYFQKSKYEAVSTFILEAKENSGSGLAGLASQIGFDISTMSGNSNLFGGDNILEIIKSKFIVEKVLLSAGDTIKDKSQTLADIYLEFSGLKNKIDKKLPSPNTISFQAAKPGNTLSLFQDSVLELIHTEVVKRNVVKVEMVSKKASIIRVVTTSPSAVFSKYFTERLIEETKKFYIDVKTRNATNNIKALEKRADSLFGVINQKSGQSATLQIADLNPAVKIAEVPVEISQRGKMVALALYTEVMKNLEASRMGLANQTPVIQILDSPKFPLTDMRKSFFVLNLFGVVCGLAVGFIFSFFTFSNKVFS